MWIKTIASHILRSFAEERRRVVSEWRILIAARRYAHARNEPLPNEEKGRAIRYELLRRGDISSIRSVEGVYQIDAAYANLLEISEEQVIQEANPWTVFGFLTAMAHHGLTDLSPQKIYAIQFKGGDHLKRTPLGTTPDDWADDLKVPSSRQPSHVGDVEIIWTEIKGDWEFGVTIGYSFGLPIYLTDVERTLLDAIRMPEKCGGIAKVLRAWRSAEAMNLDRVIAYTDRYGINNLKQRVGYLLEKLGHEHSRLEEWRRGRQRGAR